MRHRIIPAIMSGGAGERLWPLSTPERPKQFHVIRGRHSLIQDTALRVGADTDEITFLAPMVLCNVTHASLVEMHLSAIEVTPSAIALEPEARNTAATAATAGALASEIDPDALVLLLPADHIVDDRAAFLDAVARAAPFASERLATFGINPSRPATGYGYIKQGAAAGEGVYAIDSFREKPNAATAEAYLREGGYLWNAGVFLFHPGVLMREMEAAPKIRDAARASVSKAKRVGASVMLDPDSFRAAPALSFDIAVMERTERAVVAPCDIGWTDVGAWDEIWRLSEKDEAGNSANGQTVFLDASANLVHTNGPHVCIAGVRDLIVVATRETVIVLPRARAHEVKRLKELSIKRD